MSKKRQGKVAVVTGASKGIGASIAEALAEEGASVIVNYSSSKHAAEGVVAEISARGGRAIAVQGDVSPAHIGISLGSVVSSLRPPTPDRVAKLNTLTPYKVAPWQRKSGGTVYAYAEPGSCKCVYVGRARPAEGV